MGFPNEFEHVLYELGAYEMPIYPCVKMALELKWDTEIIREDTRNRIATVPMDLAQYIKEYIYWKYEC